MHEQCLPDAKFELVHEVDDHHLGYIELLPRQFKSLPEGILPTLNEITNKGRVIELTMVGTDEVVLSKPLTRAPATAWPMRYTKSRTACTFS